MVACVIPQDSRKACPRPQIHAASNLATTDVNVYKQLGGNVGYNMVAKIFKLLQHTNIRHMRETDTTLYEEQ